MYNVFHLKNGLKIVTENIDYVNSVSVGLWIKNGSRNENIKNNGISHFIEHMMFKGTKSRTAKELAECIEDVGGQINAFTGKEATCYYVKLLDTYLELALEILSDMLLNSTFTEEDIEREKGVIIEEINMSEDSPEDVLMDLHSIASWGDDSIALPILGTIDTVKNFTRSQLLEYLNENYNPSNSVISISGKIDLNSIEALLEKYFGEFHNSRKPSIEYSKPLIENNILYKKKNIEQLHMNFGINGVEIGSDDLYPLLILNNIIGGGVSSILFQKIREDMGICYSIYSYLSSYNNTGLVNIYCSLNPDNAIDAIKTIKKEIECFSNSGISEEKLRKTKEQVKGNYILGLESTSSRMFSNGKSVLLLDKIHEPIEIIKKIDNIDLTSVNRVLDKTFKKGLINVAFVGNNSDFELLSEISRNEIIAFKNHKSINI